MILLIEKIIFRYQSRDIEEKASSINQEENIREVLITENNCMIFPKDRNSSDFPVYNKDLYQNRKYKSETKLTNIKEKITHKKNASLNINKSIIEDFNDSSDIDKKEKEFKDIISQIGKFSTVANEKCNYLMKIVKIKGIINNITINEITFSNNPISLRSRPNNSNPFHFTTYFILMALSVHGFFEGFAVGVQNEDIEIGYMFMAIFFHKWVEALTIVYNFFTRVLS